MDYEKKYKEALEKIRSLHRDYNQISTLIDVKEELENIFPELAESEGEGIRKALLEMVHDTTGDSLWVDYNVHKEDAIAWLEKQGEPVEINPTEFDTRLQALIGKFDSLPKEELIGSLSFWMNMIQNDGTYKSDEKQGEQKPTEEYNITGIGSKNAQGKLGEMIKKLKPVNEVLEQKPTWIEEDESNLQGIIDEIQANKNHAPAYDLATYNRFLSWLKSLKDRVQLQNIEYYNPYKEVVESIAKMCQHYDNMDVGSLQDFYDNVKVKCKDAKEYDSLFPQSTWKPTEQQMKVLNEVINFAADHGTMRWNDYIYNVLKGLREQLNKL